MPGAIFCKFLTAVFSFIMRYKISDNINFLSLPEYFKTGNRYAANNFFLVKYKLEDRQFVINETTKIFIEKFSNPKTFQQLCKEIASEVNGSIESIRKLIQPFFKYIKHRHFIVPENYVAVKTKTDALFTAGSILDQYKIDEVIDVGYAIDIYKALDLRSEKYVVIKLLKHLLEAKVSELEREFNFLELLNKTSVAPEAYEFKTTSTYTYFIQDFIGGLSLPQFLHCKKNLKPDFILALISKILKAFKEIHTVNIIHGDIHPSNIIITNENEIKIIDFGLALNNALDKNELVNFGGAYFFMPPERIKKTSYKKFTRKPGFCSDVFQLGTVMYMLLYDDYPFNGITWEELATEIKEKPVEFPATSHYKFYVPQWLQNIIAKCLAKKPGKRFLNAHELYNAFSKNIKDNAGKVRSAVKI